MEQDEVYLIDMWRVLVREWRWFTAGLLLVLAGAFFIAHTAKPRYEATAWIQIGQVGTIPKGHDPKAEPFQRVLDRLQTVAFQDQVTGSLGFAPQSPEARLYHRSLKIEPSPYADLIKFSVRAGSPEQARRFVTATLEQLQAIHRQLQVAPLQQAHARLDQIQAGLQAAQAERERLQQAQDKGQDAALAGMLLSTRNAEIRSLQEARSDLVDELHPPYTYETSMPWPPYVPDYPVSPNRILIWGLGLLLGIGFGFFAAIARRALRREASRR